MKPQGSSSNKSESSELYNCTPLYVFSKSSSVLTNAGLFRVLLCQFPLNFFSDRDMGAWTKVQICNSLGWICNFACLAPGNTSSFILVFKHSAFFPHLSVLDSGRNENLIGAECLLNFFMPLRDQLQNCLGTDEFPWVIQKQHLRMIRDNTDRIRRTSCPALKKRGSCFIGVFIISPAEA